jgi:Putative Actinobacterial Holin-X, holin superfamily III
MAVQPYYGKTRSETPHEPVPIADAAEHTLAAAERLLRDWVELARLQATETIRNGAVSAGALAAAGLLAILAWVGISVALGLLLFRWLPGDAAAAVVAGANALGAFGLVAWTRRRRASAGEA